MNTDGGVEGCGVSGVGDVEFRVDERNAKNNYWPTLEMDVNYGVTQNKHRSEWRQPGEVKEILEIVNRS